VNKKFLTALGASLSLFLLVGCGGSANTTDTTNTTATAASVTNTASTTNAAGNVSIAFGSMLGSQLGKDGLTAEFLTAADFTSNLELALAGTPKMNPQQAIEVIKPLVQAIQQAKAENKALPKPPVGANLGEAFGSLIGTQLLQGGFKPGELNLAELATAFDAARAGTPPMTEEEAVKIVQAVAQAKMPAPPPPAPADPQAEKAGKEFLAANAKKANIKTTPSGLQYEVLKEGKGTRPTLQNTVKVHYHGTLITGKVFDSSVERKEPIEFPLGGVIKGWQEGVALMTPGSKYKLYIPHELGYGGQNAGQIPPFSTLIFEVELLEVK
jgi:FKBP-type peptidyl-prolyl cis-trans isomerase FklB